MNWRRVVNETESEVAANSARYNLLLLTRMRWMAIGGQLSAITIVHYAFGVSLPRQEMAVVIAFQIIINLSSLWRGRILKRASEITLTIELLLDMVALTIMLFLSGGASNPFVSLLMLQVVLGIILLSARFALVLLLAAIASHYWLLSHGLPLSLPGGGHHHSAAPASAGTAEIFFDLHLQGMFLSFAIAACLLFWLVTRIMSNLRARDTKLADMKRQLVDEDHLVRLGLLASGAAHELGTPLTTLAVTLDDWLVQGLPDRSSINQQLSNMLSEISRCREIVSDMLWSSGQERLEEAETRYAKDFFTEVAATWIADTRNDVGIEVFAKDNPEIVADPMLEQTIRQLLENAAESGASHVAIHLSNKDDGMLEIMLADDGPGFPDDVLSSPGQPYLSHRQGVGRGLGLFLTNNVLRRLKGQMMLANKREGGAIVSLRLPTLERELA